MQKEFFILIGRSGSGKSTIAKLLLDNKKSLYKKHFLENQEKIEIKHISTGKNFREFVKKENHTAKITRNIIEEGYSAPEFLAIWNWSDTFIKNIKNDNTSIILDGAPRRIQEAKMVIEACKFYNFKKINIIYLNTDAKISKKRILSRAEKEKRNDDTEKSLKEKNNWFDKEVLPIIDNYKLVKDKTIKLIEINANNSIESVWDELLKYIK